MVSSGRKMVLGIENYIQKHVVLVLLDARYFSENNIDRHGEVY